MAEKKTNVVFWENQGPDDIIFRSPHEDLRTITSVTVPEHAVALFIRDGKMEGVLEPGRHVITSANIPWLTKLWQLALGYKETPFKVWIVYISMKMFNGKWGIRGMMKAAEEYQVPITLMANGDYQFRIDDVAVFYTQVLGGMTQFTTGNVNSFMKSFIAEQITQQLAQKYYMEIMTNLELASTNTKILIEQYFTQRGIELLALKINEVATTEEEKEKVFEYLQFSSSRGEAYKRYEVMDRMADAIGNSEGGAAMGTGMLLFPQMYQQLQQQPVQGINGGNNNAGNNAPQVICSACGGLNPYPYKFCSNCGTAAPVPRATNNASVNQPQGGNKSFKNCPYCGEDLSGLPKTPVFCPYCSERLS